MANSYKNLEWINKGATGSNHVVRYAGLIIRVLALSVDVLIISLVSYGLQELFLTDKTMGIVGFAQELLRAAQQSSKGVTMPDMYSVLEPFKARADIILYNLAFIVFYFTVFNCSRFQGTLGKWVFKIHVIGRHGQKISILRSIFRLITIVVVYSFSMAAAIFIVPLTQSFAGPYYVLFYLLFAYIDLLVIAFNKRKMALHDFIADTRVMAGPAGCYAQKLGNGDDNIENVGRKGKGKEDDSGKIEGQKTW